MRFVSLALFSLITGAAPALAQVFASEFNLPPLDEGWMLGQQYCEPETWNEDGWYHQQLDNDACPKQPDGAGDTYTRSIQEYNGVAHWFLDFHVATTGDRSEIPGGAPTVVATANFFGISYNATVALDQVKLFRDTDLPILFFDLEPEIPHIIRLELENNQPPTYCWYIDGQAVDEGLAEGPFPADDSRLSWRGKSWHLPCHNQWDFIRFGVTPEDGSGDYNSDGQINSIDFYFFEECVVNSGSGVDAGPGCRFADFDADTDVDCTDWDGFQNAWTDPSDPPILFPCFTEPIPTVSHWGVAVMILLLLTAGTIVFGDRRACRNVTPSYGPI